MSVDGDPLERRPKIRLDSGVAGSLQVSPGSAASHRTVGPSRWLEGNRLQLLREIVPAASLFAVVLNPCTPYAALAYKELEAAAHVAKVELRVFEVRSPE
jgi:putative tryptophan/tyrosine transport system substrate-binding protein